MEIFVDGRNITSEINGLPVDGTKRVHSAILRKISSAGDVRAIFSSGTITQSLNRSVNRNCLDTPTLKLLEYRIIQNNVLNRIFLERGQCVNVVVQSFEREMKQQSINRQRD